MVADFLNVVDVNKYNFLHSSSDLYEAAKLAFTKEAEEWVDKNMQNKSKPTEIMVENKLDITITNKCSSYGNSRIYRYRVGDESVLRFDQIPYPECCGITIIKNFSANSSMSKTDFLDAMDKFIKDQQDNDRFSKALFYTTADSTGAKLFSMINGITILDQFKNKRSGNMLIGFEIDLLEKSTREGWHSMDLGEDDFDEEETDGDEEEDLFDVDGATELLQAIQTQSQINVASSSVTQMVKGQAYLDGVGPGVWEIYTDGSRPVYCDMSGTQSSWSNFSIQEGPVDGRDLRF